MANRRVYLRLIVDRQSIVSIWPVVMSWAVQKFTFEFKGSPFSLSYVLNQIAQKPHSSSYGAMRNTLRVRKQRDSIK
jgi:hypothetical protein